MTQEETIAGLETELKKWKLLASEQTEFATRHQRDTLRAQQEALSANKARDVWREEFVRVETEVERLRQRVSRAEERANASGLENISLIGQLGEAKADLDRARVALSGVCSELEQARAENGRQAALIAALQDAGKTSTQGHHETLTQCVNRQGRQITDLRDLLTSAHAIAARGGEDTNWEAFIGQLKKRGIGSITAKVFKLPKDTAIFWNPYNGVVCDHRDGTIIQPDTDKERAKRGLPPFTPDPGPQKLRDRIRHAINCTSAENESDTPDFILAGYLMASLDAFNAATRTREKWYGREQKPVDEVPEFTVKSLGTDGGVGAEPEPTVMAYDPAAFTRVIGQAWCLVGSRITSDMLVMRSETHHATLVLCAIHQNLTTGETTYVPISFDDLPKVTETPAR